MGLFNLNAYKQQQGRLDLLCPSYQTTPAPAVLERKTTLWIPMTHPLDQAVDRGETPVELLNGLTTPGFGWVLRHANKDHKDQFGSTINAGDQYYARDLPNGGTTTFRLSRESMERMLDTMFTLNYLGTELACKLSKQNELNTENGLRVAAATLDARPL